MNFRYQKQDLFILQKNIHLETNCYISCINNLGEHINIFIKNGAKSKRFNIIEPCNLISAEIFKKGENNYLSSFQLQKSRPELNFFKEYQKLFKILQISQKIFENKEFTRKNFKFIIESIHNPCFKKDFFIEYFLTNLLYNEGLISESNQSNEKQVNKIIFYMINTPINKVHKLKLDIKNKKLINNFLKKNIEDIFNSPSLLKLLQE